MSQTLGREHVPASHESPVLLDEVHTAPSCHCGAHVTHPPLVLLLPSPHTLHAAHPALGSAKAKFSQDSKPWLRLLALPGGLFPLSSDQRAHQVRASGQNVCRREQKKQGFKHRVPQQPRASLSAPSPLSFLFQAPPCTTCLGPPRAP